MIYTIVKYLCALCIVLLNAACSPHLQLADYNRSIVKISDDSDGYYCNGFVFGEDDNNYYIATAGHCFSNSEIYMSINYDNAEIINQENICFNKAYKLTYLYKQNAEIYYMGKLQQSTYADTAILGLEKQQIECRLAVLPISLAKLDCRNKKVEVEVIDARGFATEGRILETNSNILSLELNKPLTQGSSGGPIFSISSGESVGIFTTTMPRGVSNSDLLKYLETRKQSNGKEILLADRKVHKLYLGVQIAAAFVSASGILCGAEYLLNKNIVGGFCRDTSSDTRTTGAINVQW